MTRLRRLARAFLLALLSLLGLAGCGGMIQGGNSPAPRAAHFVLTVHNLDLAFPDTASICWWEGSSIVGTAECGMPAGGDARFDLGTTKPDGIQVLSTAWNGILMGPGGYVLQGPDYADSWGPTLYYPTGFVQK